MVNKFDKLSKVILIISVIIIAFSFFAPVIFVQESKFGLDFSKTGPIGDTIGGIMNPFIALSGVFLTFLAFYIQLKANQQQRILFTQELRAQNLQHRKNQIETQFYEMVRLHKENINDISVMTKFSVGGDVQDEKITGREVFKYFLNEIKILYYVAKKEFHELDKDSILNKAYHIFFQGIDYYLVDQKSIPDKQILEYINKLKKIRDNNSNNGHEFNNLMQAYNIQAYRYQYALFCGYSSILSHYYRHLFLTVKFIANQQEELIDYSEKRKYLRILRAQLSNPEQEMLFYNWKSEYGINWENETNHFFTDYRMIHNIQSNMAIKDFDLVQIFKLDDGQYYKIEPNRIDDILFEFQNWEM
jgi:hypothetical protein